MKKILCLALALFWVSGLLGCSKNAEFTPIPKSEVEACMNLDKMDGMYDTSEYNQDENKLIINITDELAELYLFQYRLVNFSKSTTEETYKETLDKANKDWNDYKQKWINTGSMSQELLNDKFKGNAKIEFKIYSKDKVLCLSVAGGEVTYDQSVEILKNDK